MRSIQKQGSGGYHLGQAHADPPQTAAQATSRWSRFAHKSHVQQCLLDEQYHLCCYSELRADEEALGYHIEHVHNKSQQPQRTFDYGNLAASALHGEQGLPALSAQAVALFGGHAPGKAGRWGAVDMALFVPPHDPACHRFFAFLSDGRIEPAQNLQAPERRRAQYTIDTLNLNSPYLVTERRKWWDELDRLFQEHLAKGWSLAHLAAVDLVPIDGKLSRFFSLTRQFYAGVAEDCLQQQAPQLL